MTPKTSRRGGTRIAGPGKRIGRPKGPPKKKIGLNLLVESCEWLDRQPDKSAAVDRLIDQAIRTDA